ncbi:unnamed protein product [Ectocarpus sp. 6 AP-2014]
MEYSSTDNELTAQIFGDISTPAPWVALSYVMSAVSLMLVDFPGLRWKGCLKCPQHGNEMPFANKVNRAGDKLLERECPRCSPETRGLGAAAIDLVCMVDIRLDRDVIFREVKARFVVLESQYFSCPTGSSKTEDELLRKIEDMAIAVKVMTGRLDKVLESTQESLMRLTNLQAPNYLYPRLVVVKEDGNGGRSSRANGWKRCLPSKLRGVGKKDMTLHFLCPVDMTEVPCGPGGEGYRFQETRDWVKKISPVLQVTLVTAKVALNAVTGLNVDVSGFLKDVQDGLMGEIVDRTLDEDALLRAVLGDGAIDTDLQRDTRASYEALKVFMENEERRRRKNARDGDGYIDFRDKMKLLPDGRGGEVWIRNENVQKWLDSNSSPAPSR